MHAHKQVVTGAGRDLARIRQPLPGTSIGSQELATNLELNSYNWGLRFDLRYS